MNKYIVWYDDNWWYIDSIVEAQSAEDALKKKTVRWATGWCVTKYTKFPYPDPNYNLEDIIVQE